MSHDDIMEGFFRRSEAPSVEAFGGIDVLLGSATELGASIYSDYYFELVFPFREAKRSQVDAFIVDLLTSVARGPELSTIMNHLFGVTLEDRNAEQRLFRHFLKTATDWRNAVPLRASSLKGALGLVKGDNARIARIVAEVAETDPNDDPSYIAHAARVAGILFGHRKEPALVEFLRSVRGKDGCADQVELELGLIGLGNAIGADSIADVEASLAEAKEAFSTASNLRDSRYDAKIYLSAIDLLLGFYCRRTDDNIGHRLREMRSDAFAYAHYSGGKAADPMLGAIATQTVALFGLVQSLELLMERLADDIWMEAAAVIENQLVTAYSANHTILGGVSGHGVDCVIRPIVHPCLFGNHHHAAALRTWLRTRADYMPADLVDDLRVAVEDYFEKGDGRDPSGAGISGPLTPALEERVRSTDPKGFALLPRIIDFAASEMKGNISLPLERAVGKIDAALRGHEDYDVEDVQLAFGNLVFRLLSFVEQRLDSSFEQDAFSAYLFVKEKPFPLEKALQQDLLRHLKALRLPIDDEVKGKAGGRADLRYKSNAHELIIEVKREFDDASFDGLLASYGDQTVIYQTTNVKLGVMMVLDLTEPHENLGHIDLYYATRTGDLLGDGTNRGVVIIKVPGRRGTPSNATKIAKSKEGKKVRAAKAKPAAAE